MEPGRSLLKIIRIGPRHCPLPGRWWMGGGGRGAQGMSVILPVLAGEMKGGIQPAWGLYPPWSTQISGARWGQS